MKLIGKERGFTLIEMLMVLFFAGVLIAVLFNLYDWHTRLYGYQQALVRTSTSSRAAVSAMQSYVSQANLVLSSASVNGTTYSSSANVLVLELPAINNSGNALPGKWDKAAFYPSGTNFYLQLEPDPASSRVKLNKILSDTLQSASFTYNNADFAQVTEVTVNFQSQIQIKNQNVNSNLRQNMYLINF